MQALDGARTVAEVARQLLWLHCTSRPLLTERFVATGDAAAWTAACGMLAGHQAETSDSDEGDGDGDGGGGGEGSGDGEHASEEQQAGGSEHGAEEEGSGAEEEGSGGEGLFDDPLEALAQLALGKLAAAEEPVETNTEQKLDQLGKLFNDLAAGMDQVRLLVQYPHDGA